MQKQPTKTNKDFDVGKIADLTFNLVTRCQEKEARFAQQFDMGVAEFRCLRHLYQNPGATVKQLAEYMNLTSSRLTRIIDKLVEKNLVSRKEGIEDRRIFIVDLTPKGKPLAKKLFENYLKLHEEIFSTIPGSQFANIARSLDEILKAVNNWLYTQSSERKNEKT